MYQATYIIVIFSLFRRIGETFFSLLKFWFFWSKFFLVWYWYGTGTGTGQFFSHWMPPDLFTTRIRTGTLLTIFHNLCIYLRKIYTNIREQKNTNDVRNFGIACQDTWKLLRKYRTKMSKNLRFVTFSVDFSLRRLNIR